MLDEQAEQMRRSARAANTSEMRIIDFMPLFFCFMIDHIVSHISQCLVLHHPAIHNEEQCQDAEQDGEEEDERLMQARIFDA